MKTIVVYYSMEGHTEYVAQKIAQATGAELLRLQPAKPYPTGKFGKFFFGGKAAVFGETPALAPYSFDAGAYDTVVLGTPTWAGRFTPPLKTFLKENPLAGKRVGLVVCSAGGNAEGVFEKLRQALPGAQVVATLGLQNPQESDVGGNEEGIKAFCGKL